LQRRICHHYAGKGCCDGEGQAFGSGIDLSLWDFERCPVFIRAIFGAFPAANNKFYKVVLRLLNLPI
jgi:hypothetical protein